MRRLLPFIVVAAIPVVILTALHPGSLMPGGQAGAEPAFLSVPGSDVVAFVRDGCPHCADFELFMEEQGIPVTYYEISELLSQDYFTKVQARIPGLQQGVPTVVIDGHVRQGYDTDERDGKPLLRLLAECQASSGGCLSFESFLAGEGEGTLTESEAKCTENCELDAGKYVFDLWIFGEVDLRLLSLPSLALLLGFLDGFNPCAMWVLISLLTLLIATHDLRKILVVGGTFLFVSGAMYYMFIAAWLNVFLLIGLNFWVQKMIGLVAVCAGVFYLWEAFGKDPNQCNVTDMNRRQRIIARMKNVVAISQWPLMLAGVSVLAISVNMIELVCTAGLPAVFTQILALSDITNLQRYLYIGLFILMYMIDDTIIFLIAIFTMRATGMTTKYRRFTLIFGGVLMYALGILLIFFPDALTFG